MDEQTTNDAAAAGPEQTPPQAAGEVREIQQSSAAADATMTVFEVTAEPQAPPPDRGVVAEMVTRFLGHQGITARDMVAELNDDEAREVILAGGDRFTARVEIKAIFGRAYDRRRDEAGKLLQRQAAPGQEPVAIGSDPNAGKPQPDGHEAPAGVAPDAKIQENKKDKPAKPA